MESSGLTLHSCFSRNGEAVFKQLRRAFRLAACAALPR